MDDAPIHVEIARIADVLLRVPEAASSWLSGSEHARLTGLRVDARRDQYCAGHWLVRELLARRVEGDATSFSLIECQSQPPRVAGDDGLCVSISHSGDWVAAAVARSPIGIDLEQRPRALSPAIAAMLLNPEEPPGTLDADALLARWVAKEAWIKRRAGSALPAQLQLIRLEPAPLLKADIRMTQAEAFHFAMAAAPGREIARRSSVALVDREGYRVLEAT